MYYNRIHSPKKRQVVLGSEVERKCYALFLQI